MRGRGNSPPCLTSSNEIRGDMENLTLICPFWNGHSTIGQLLDSLPDDLPVIIVDDQSDEPLSLEPLQLDRANVRVEHPPDKGWFAGAVNYGVNLTDTDCLIVNQDAWFEGCLVIPRGLKATCKARLCT